MYMSQMFVSTLREVPGDAEILSHQLMLRSGLIRKVASGVYSFLPLGYKVIKKIQQIIREEMDESGAQELLMPAILPAELFKQTGRFELYGPEMFRLKDRNERDFCLGPTHEEIFTDIVKSDIRSYKQLSTNLYQIQTKYRDERRPRFGVMRSREFIMKDAYSFDKDDAGLNESYDKMHDTYVRIFNKCNLDYKVVEADSGAIGGSNSEEFMVKSEVGEDTIVFCNSCEYSANIEKAECLNNSSANETEELPREKVLTPDIKTMEKLIKFFNMDDKCAVKTILYKSDDELIAAVVRGDREINETKLQNLLGCIELEIAEGEEVKKVTNSEIGYAGPVGLDIKIIADSEVVNMKNFVAGANETDYHFKNVNINRDFEPSMIADIKNIKEGDLCPKCEHPVEFAQGVEVGHIFKLGTKYSEAMDCKYIDENGEEKLMVMGCYGIGINRTMAAIIEQNSDENGIIWPVSVAPYHVIVTPINVNDEKQFDVAQSIYKSLVDNGIETVLDDRNERPGVKFKDADLIGFPIRITVGKKVNEDIVEFKERQKEDFEEVNVNNVIDKVNELLK